MNKNELKKGDFVKIDNGGSKYNGYYGKVVQNFPADNFLMLEISELRDDGVDRHEQLMSYEHVEPCCTYHDMVLADQITKIEGKKHGDDQHYHKCKIEPIEYILANGLGFCEGNIVKYITRYKDKGKPLDDLRKIKVYVDYLIDNITDKNNGEGKN